MFKKTFLILLLVFVLSIFFIYKNSDQNVTAGVTIDSQIIKKEPVPEFVSVLFLGDMMFDRSVRVKAGGIGYEAIFGTATTTIQKHDLTIANLEGPITSFKSKLVNDSGKAISGFQFTFDNKVAPALKNVGIDIVSLANNHTDNFGQEGLNQTRKTLSENDVMYFGSPRNNPAYTATSTCVNDICIGVIGWHEFSYANDQFIVDKIKEMRPTVDYLVMYPHWGTEYSLTPNKKQIKLAHEWIDAGADVVIGHHPHVVQTVEEYKGKYIFYSLGNFIFDQYFSFNTTHGIGVSVDVYKDKVDYKIIPFANVGHRVSVLSEENKIKVFDILRSVSSGDLLEGMLR
jgi:poly-gamma-glutamate synthesis protein (capsule biosynthesis protein)